MIAPVPLHWVRLVSRRYNQSAELSRRLAKRNDKLSAPDLLIRKRRTPPQAGLSAKQRARNMRGAFSLHKKWMDRVAGKRVLLIDDVYTTGATVTAATGQLLWAGAAAVDVLTVARVVRPERE